MNVTGTNQGRDQAYKYELFGTTAGKSIGDKSDAVQVVFTRQLGSKDVEVKMTASVTELPTGHLVVETKAGAALRQLKLSKVEHR